MANHSTLAQRDRDLDEGVLDLPAKDRPALKKFDQATRRASEACYGDYPGVAQKKKSAKKRAKKSASLRTAKKTTPAYSNETPKGLWPVGTTVKYLGGSKLRNDWLKKGAMGRIFAYRPGRKGGGLYAVRFAQGTTMLSVKRVERALKGGGQ